MNRPEGISEEEWDLVMPFVDMQRQRDLALRELDHAKTQLARMQLDIDDVREWIALAYPLGPDQGIALMQWMSDILEGSYRRREKRR